MAHTVDGPFTQFGRPVYIAEAVRTPIGKSHAERGWYRDTHPNAMLAACYTDLIERTGIDPALVEDLVIGCTAPFGEQSRNIARNAWLQAGFPPEVPATVLDRRCGSAQTAVEMGAALIASGTHDLVIAGESNTWDTYPSTRRARSASCTATPGPTSYANAMPLCTKAKAPN
jgi:acetyl-CoA acyltransferase